MWHEVICSFDLQSDPVQVKSRLVAFLAAHAVPHVVESYYDGLAPGLTPEAAGESIHADADGLPLVIYCETQTAAEQLVGLIAARFHPALAPTVRPLPETASHNAWSDGDTFSAGRFVIQPAGLAGHLPEGKMLISIKPGEAFGSGRHVTTLAMLGALDGLFVRLGLKKFPPNVLDIGTGNGVLLIAAALLGARSVTGTDLTADIISEARENLALNNVQGHLVVTDKVPVNLPPQQLVMANIPIAALRPLVPQMIAAAAPEAFFLLAGFTREDAGVFQKELAPIGLEILAETEERGWSALLLRHV